MSECKCSCGCQNWYEIEVTICSDCHSGEHQNQNEVELCGDCLYPIADCEHGREFKR
jgi:hypothetical protein